MSEKFTKLASYIERYAGANILSTPGQIKQWQTFLNTQKAGIAADGIWGPQTARATENFQMNSGLEQTGTVDAQTLSVAQGKSQPAQKDPSQMSADELIAWQVEQDKKNPEAAAHADKVRHTQLQKDQRYTYLIEQGYTPEQANARLDRQPGGTSQQAARTREQGYYQTDAQGNRVSDHQALETAPRRTDYSQEKLNTPARPDVDTTITSSKADQALKYATILSKIVDGVS